MYYITIAILITLAFLGLGGTCIHFHPFSKRNILTYLFTFALALFVGMALDAFNNRLIELEEYRYQHNHK